MTTTVTVDNPEQTRALGQALAAHLRGGDVIMLRGELGAGKTTFTQGIGRGLGVRGTVASPTFIVARVHPPEAPGATLSLIHVDAYRIKDVDDLETLDLDSSMDDAVTVIEWGDGKTEGLSPDRLHIDIERAGAGDIVVNDDGSVNLEDMDNGKRIVTFTPSSSRWDDVDFSAL